jgi:N-acetylglucosaminyl-diphospho-decaprenol L-rhamnosyltransferase
MPAIGIVIVTYNSEAVIGPCLDAALRSGAAIVVVDNASADGTRAAVSGRGVRLLTNDSNLGFAKAVNQGFAVLDCPYVLLLNPDAVLKTGLEPLREACDLPGAAGAGGMLLDSGGRPQAGFMVRQLPSAAVLAMEALLLNRLWPGNPINAAYRGLRLDYAVQQRVEQPAGAFFLIRRAVWEELGGFDERFWPLWFEDVDFCRRALDRGYCFYYVPSVVAIHTGGHSIPALTLEMRRVYWYRSLLGYATKHFRPPGVRAVCVAVIIGSFLRAAAEAALQASLGPFATYGKIVRLAGRLLVRRIPANADLV